MKMLNRCFATVFLCVMAFGVVAIADEDTLNVMTFNIRYDNPADGENAWPNRVDRVARTIIDSKADIICVQEALRHQLDQLAGKLLNFAWVGVGRDDGEDAGEFSPIFYRKERFSLIDSGTFWLSPTPEEVGSVGWDAALTRICTWALLKDAKLGEIAVFNTHFDHRGEEARENSVRVIFNRMSEIAGDRRAVLAGDFNFNSQSIPYALVLKAGWNNAVTFAASSEGPTWSFHGWSGEGEDGKRIDFIFVRNKIWKVLKHRVIDTSYDGRFPSDHLPVIATLEPR